MCQHTFTSVSAGCEACWELTHPALEPIGGCFEAGTTVDVALPANGGYVARLRLRDVATQAVVAEAVREFVAGPPEKCAARLRGHPARCGKRAARLAGTPPMLANAAACPCGFALV